MLDLNQAWAKNDDELIAIIGASLAPKRLGMAPTDPDQQKARGRQWIEKHKSALCALLCQNSVIKNIGSGASIKFDFCVIAVDILEHNFGKISPVPPAAAAVLFFRLGFHSLCAGNHNE